MSAYSCTESELEGPDIAVVGMAARLPGASDVSTYWRNLRAGRECIERLSDEQLRRVGVPEVDLRDPNYVKAAAILGELEQFDAKFFGFSPREASILDPQHRHFLEVCWEALESAGVLPERFEGPIGVFGGSGMNAYMPYHLFTNSELMRQVGLFLIRHTGNDKDFLATRVSYCLNLQGPSVNVQTACSTSLVAIHLAIQSLLSGECALALAGGVTIELPHYRGYHYQEGEILSPDGRCRPFEARSKGTVFGSGAGVVVLRKLRDAVENGDYIHAVIKGSAINNDGNRKVGYLAPSVDGQVDCIAEALSVAGLEPQDISYVECHGTGTKVGDPIEVAALTQAFGTSSEPYCGIGSVKSNIGHLDTAAGVASFIKVVEMLKHEEQAPTLHFEEPNPDIPFGTTPFRVVNGLRPWPRSATPRRAGVSSLGVGGTNAHVVLQEAPPRQSAVDSQQPQLLFLSARSQASLERLSKQLAEELEHAPQPLSEVASTLLHGRRRFPFCRVLAAHDLDEARQLLSRPADGRRSHDVHAASDAKEVVFLFPGGGAQYANMARTVYESEPAFRAQLDACCALLERQEKLTLKPLLFPPAGQEESASAELERPSLALPALLAIEISYAALLATWGIKPVAMVGHSVGEYAAAYLAQVLSLEDAFRIVCLRGRLFEKTKPGGMLSVPMAAEAVEPLLGERLAIAAVNGPQLCVVSGENADLDALAERLRSMDVEPQRLHIHIAAHSPLLDPILEEFGQELAKLRFRAPTTPYVSNLTGELMPADKAPDGSYFVKHLRGSVRFSQCIQTLAKAHPRAVLLEVGPGQALSSMLRSHPARAATQPSFSVSPHAKDRSSEAAYLRTAIGRLWAHGIEPNWSAMSGIEARRIIPLPSTPFEHERHWIEPGKGFFMHDTDDDHAHAREADPARWFTVPEFREAPRGPSNLGQDEHWLVLADLGPLADALTSALRERGIRATVVSPSANGVSDEHSLGLARPEDYERLIGRLSAAGDLPQRIVHALLLCKPQSEQDDQLNRAFFSLMHLAQALASEAVSERIELLVATARGYAVGDSPAQHALHALAQGPVLVIPRELPELQTRLFDLDPQSPPERLAKAIVDELACATEQRLVAEREGRRFEQAAVRPALPASLPVLPEAPVFMFTGGLGGISLTLARHAAQRYGARLVLLSRSGAPKADSTRAEDRERRAALDKLEQAGHQVLVVKADLSETEQGQDAVRQTLASFGRIDVVVHAAGVIDDGLLANKTRSSARGVLRPKLDGTEALLQALKAAPPKHLVLISSTSAVLGPPGQIDYVAANAYANARALTAAALLPETRTLALGFGVWRDTGMAARAARPAESVLEGTPVGHPLLGLEQRHDDGSISYRAHYRVQELWVLDEHRLRGGAAILPGTAYLEIVRAAYLRAFKLAAHEPIEIGNLGFTTALEVPDDGLREVTVRVSKADEGDAHVVSVSSRAPQDAHEVEHARATVRRATSARPKPLPVKELQKRTSASHVSFGEGEQNLPQERVLAFGPRWKVLRTMHFGRDEALATLELPERMADDLRQLPMHPGLLDMASGFAFALADGAGETERVRVPVAYERVRVYGDLTPRLLAHVRCRSSDSVSGAAIFDMALSTLEGEVLLEVEGYATLSIARSAFRRPEQTPAARSLLDRWLEHGISAEEGADIFERVLASDLRGPVYASPVPLHVLEQDLLPARAQPAVSEKSATSEQATTSSDGPRDDVERQLVALMQALLGVEQLGIRQSFFDLGGHSLIAVRLFSRIKKTFGVDLSLAVLFEAPSVEGLAERVRAALGLPFSPSAEPGAAPTAALPSAASATLEFSPLVTIQAGDGQHPFFCVHGAGGNVLNFHDLARGLGSHQTFYGLQAQGVDGELPPLESIEAMAQLYLPAIRRVQPHGPYLLGGYSGGGVVAYEMAQRLRRDGEQVALLVLLDTFHPHTEGRKAGLSARVAQLREGGLSGLRQLVRSKLDRTRTTLMRDWTLKLLEQQGLPLPMELRDVRLTNNFLAASRRYQPAPYDGPVTLFRAEEVAPFYAHVSERLDWDALIPRLRLLEVPGDHDSLLQKPHIQVLVEHLRRAIESAIAAPAERTRTSPSAAAAQHSTV